MKKLLMIAGACAFALALSGCVVTQAQLGTDIQVGATLGCNLAGIVASTASKSTSGSTQAYAAKVKAAIAKTCPGVVLGADELSSILSAASALAQR